MTKKEYLAIRAKLTAEAGRAQQLARDTLGAVIVLDVKARKQTWWKKPLVGGPGKGKAVMYWPAPEQC